MPIDSSPAGSLDLWRIRTYLSVLVIFLLAYYSFKLDLSIESLSPLYAFAARFLVLSGIAVEYLAALILISIFSRLRYLTFLAYLVLLTYIVINYIQILSLEVSADFVTKLALGNVEFSGLLLTTENILICLISFILFVVVPYFVTAIVAKRRSNSGQTVQKPPRITNLVLLISGGIIFSVLINNAKYWVPDETIEAQSKLFRKNNIKQLKPVNQFAKLFQEEVSDDFPTLSSEDVKTLQKYGYSINPARRFPLLKDNIYESPPPFRRDKAEKPNVILIFSEGLSARTSSAYAETYPNLTPNLEAFAAESMLVTNYYNHTAATYRGLHGGLCSLFPKYGALGGWLENFENIPKTNYKCLTDIFAGRGYRSLYLDPHFRNTSGLDEMMKRLKFDTVLNAEDLLENYPDGENSLRPGWISDHKMYRALVNLLEKQTQSTPFFLTMYSVETHAWVDVLEDGVKYQNGKSNVLNTIHNTDDAFGYFWRYLKASKYADNTIIVFTSDHTHYFSRPFTKLMAAYEEQNYQKLFVGQIPLIIYDPTTILPDTFDANYASSIDLAPSLIHLLGLPNEKNAFVGKSIFEKNAKYREIPGVASYEASTYVIDHEKIHSENNSDTRLQQLDLLGRYIKYVQALEVSDRIFP